MFPAPSLRPMVNSKGWVIPGVPAVPKNSAHNDQRNAADVPTEMRVSMVAAPCRALVNAARWNGQAAYVTTGAASVRESHCQYSICSAGIMAIAITGRARTTAVIRRRRSGSSSSVVGAPSPSLRVPVRGGAVSAAV